MIMNGQMNKYRESLRNMGAPAPLSKCPQIKMDLSGMLKYAKQKGVQPFELSEAEKKNFMKAK